MRISDRTSSRNYLQNMNKAKADYMKTNQQISSGNSFESISEDPSSGIRVLKVRSDKFKTEVHLNNVESINEELISAEDSMMAIEDVLSDAHSLVLKALSEDKGEVGQEAIANEIKSFKEQILQLANSKYDEKFTFGGSNASKTEPFTMDENGNLKYNGVLVEDIQKRADGTFFHEVTVPATPEIPATSTTPIIPAVPETIVEKDIPMDEDVYMDIGLGVRMKGSQIDDDTGFKISFSGLDIMGFGKDNFFNTLTDIETNLRDYDATALGKLDTKLVNETDAFLGQITEMGSKTKYLKATQARLELSVDTQQIRIHSLMGTNMEEAATELAMNDMVLKAVMQMGSRILPTSLMDFL